MTSSISAICTTASDKPKPADGSVLLYTEHDWNTTATEDFIVRAWGACGREPQLTAVMACDVVWVRRPRPKADVANARNPSHLSHFDGHNLASSVHHRRRTSAAVRARQDFVGEARLGACGPAEPLGPDHGACAACVYLMLQQRLCADVVVYRM